MTARLAPRFLLALGEPDLQATEDLEACLGALCHEARAAWPGVPVDLEAFFAFLGARLEDRKRPVEGLARLRVADLYLAFACLTGAAGSAEAFSAAYHPTLRRALARVASNASQIDDIIQSLYQKVFVPAGDRPPAINKYDGVGALRSWLRVTALRLALNLHRDRGRERPLSPELLFCRPHGGMGPETAYLKRLYSDAFKKAFEASLGALDHQSRNLLRYHYLDGLTLEQIGRICQVHKATISRRLADLREHLLNETRNALVRQLEVSHTELDSIMRLISSRLDASICRFLRRPE